MAMDTIRAVIEASGPVPFERFQATALYDPVAGYFATGPLRSTKSGDFLTSPEVSPLFGHTLARFARAELDRVGGDSVVEVGSGSGSLLRPLLDELERDVSVWAIEVSEAARASTAGAVPEATVVADAEVMPEGLRGVVVANEIADNIPVALAIRRGRAWRERWVGIEGDGLGFVEVEARPDVATWCERFAGDVIDGGQVEVQIEAGRWAAGLFGRLDAGALLVIDYGDDADGLARRRAEGTLRTYRGHHLGPDPLLEPGGTDITVDVAFDALAAVLAESGADVEVSTQRAFLAEWGIGELRDRLRTEELELARTGDTWGRLKLKSRVTEIDTLVHPRGLGDFRVLVARR